MYYVIDPFLTAQFGIGLKTVDEVKAYCKATEGRYDIVKVVGRSHTQRVEKTQTTFDLNVRSKKETKEEVKPTTKK